MSSQKPFKFNLKEKVFAVLKEKANERLTATDIAQAIFKTYPNDCEQKRKNSTAQKDPIDTDKKVIDQIRCEINSVNKALLIKYPDIKMVEERPRKFYYTTKTDSQEITEIEAVISDDNVQNNNSKVTEHSLYPKLMDYLTTEFGYYCMRIDERKSQNTQGTNGNEWLFPDIVALENLSKDWHKNLVECASNFSDKKNNLYSFEVKIKLNRSNIRKDFFQTVSNSSWAHYSYLVASEIDDKALNEFKLLSRLHGIGLIILDITDFSNSYIAIPATEKQNIDWHIANRLYTENTDFKNYITLIKEFHQTGNLKSKEWHCCDSVDD